MFCFDGRIFTQKCGIAMGTKLCPSTGHHRRGDFEEKFFQETPRRPLQWWQYIDDVLASLTHTKTQFEQFIDGLNNLAPRLHFTHKLSVFSANFFGLYIYKQADFSARGNSSQPFTTNR